MDEGFPKAFVKEKPKPTKPITQKIILSKGATVHAGPGFSIGTKSMIGTVAKGFNKKGKMTLL